MNTKDKKLLIKDLCARLPYGVKLLCANGEIVTLVNPPITIQDDCWNFKPYLRPMLSMTEEEHIKLKAVYDNGSNGLFDEYSHIDWLNANHFDYRGLIERGLALEALEDMYKTEQL